MAAVTGEIAVEPEYDRLKELTEFDETKAGVKGLTDAGVKKIPRIFIHSPKNLPTPSDGSHIITGRLEVPVIDLQGLELPARRREIVEEVRSASGSWGFFRLVNHGIPIRVLEEMLQSTRRFHEQDKEVKAEFYSRDTNRKVKFNSNFDLFKSRAANWRDTLGCVFDESLDPEELPSVCREEIMDYVKHMRGVGDKVIDILSEALGLRSDYLRSINCTKRQSLVGHYYPPCPEPELTLGTSSHSDPSFLTLLLQDGLGGLQVLHHNHWVDLTPIYGALDVNIGDFLQLISNDKFRSCKHRVLASCRGPRISVAMFLNPANKEERAYGPIKEAVSEENPPVYKEVLARDYVAGYFAKGLTGAALNHYKL